MPQSGSVSLMGYVNGTFITIMKNEYKYKAYFLRAIDGDTIEVLVDLGFDISRKMKIRIKGVNCPELNTPEGEQAQLYIKNLLQGLELQIQTYKTRTGNDKKSFTRYIGDVFIYDFVRNDFVSVADKIINNGHGVPYE